MRRKIYACSLSTWTDHYICICLSCSLRTFSSLIEEKHLKHIQVQRNVVQFLKLSTGWHNVRRFLGGLRGTLTMSPFPCLRVICAFPLSMYLFLCVCGVEDLLLYWRCRYCYWGCIGNIVVDCENVQVACSHRNTALGLGRAIPRLGFRALDFLWRVLIK